MALIRMVRHGEAAGGYSEHPDPPLSAQGRQQAEAAGAVLAGLGRQTIVSSPMLRARQTAAPLVDGWSATLRIEPAISEIPSPGLTPAQRGPWLQTVMAGSWEEAPSHVRDWRDGIVAFLLAQDEDLVGFSHFVAINAALSVATGHPSPRVAHLDHCSITTFDTSSGDLDVVAVGQEADTTVL